MPSSLPDASVKEPSIFTFTDTEFSPVPIASLGFFATAVIFPPVILILPPYPSLPVPIAAPAPFNADA